MGFNKSKINVLLLSAKKKAGRILEGRMLDEKPRGFDFARA
jgi:hypothetical protein